MFRERQIGMERGHSHTPGHHQAFVPPSTVRFAPVMYEDSGPATNATNAETTSTCPKTFDLQLIVALDHPTRVAHPVFATEQI
jgi:hypothetical protein